MADLIPWKNEEFRKLKEEMDSLYARLSADFGIARAAARAAEAVEVRRTVDGLVVRVRLPDVESEDVEVRLESGFLVIACKSETRSQGSGGVLREVGRFSSRVRLDEPVDVERAEAVYKNGELCVNLPRPRAAASARLPVRRG